MKKLGLAAIFLLLFSSCASLDFRYTTLNHAGHIKRIVDTPTLYTATPNSILTITNQDYFFYDSYFLYSSSYWQNRFWYWNRHPYWNNYWIRYYHWSSLD